MSARTCDHLKEDGVFCGSPALKGRKYCYFHLNLRGRRLKAARARRRGDNPALNVPFPEDMHAVQIALGEILWALAEDRVDTKRAGLMLYTLQQAATNLTRTPRWEGEREAVEGARPLRAINFPDFEQRFGLAPNADLSTAEDDLGAPPLSPSVGDRVGGKRLPRIPLPEEQIRRLNMTPNEQFFYFLERMRDDIPPGDMEHLESWLREHRRRRKPQPDPPASSASSPTASTTEAA
jgi:hypothetical protein